MALAPEFFVLLGIDIFLAVSIVSAILDRQLSSILQYLFQCAAGAGLAELLLGQGLTAAARVWAGIIYLAFALSSLVGLNIRLAIVRRRMSIAPIFSQMMTVPVIMVSALFLSSFLQNGGELVFSPASIVTIVTLIAVANLSIFGLLREYTTHSVIGRSGPVSLPSSPEPASPLEPGLGFKLPRSSNQGEEWEESPAKEKD